MKTWKATVNVNGTTMNTTVQAISGMQATKLLEAQYGKGCVRAIRL